MNARSGARLAVIVTTVVSASLGTLMIAGTLTGRTAAGESVSTLVAGIIFLLGVPAISLLGATIIRRTGNAIGWMFAVIPLTATISFATEAYVRAGYRPPHSLPGVAFAAWLSQIATIALVLPVPMLFLLFPTGRPLSSRWRWATRAWTAGSILTLAWAAFRDGEVYGTPYDRYPGIENPLALPGFSAVAELVLGVGIGLLMLSSALGIVCLVVRFVRARGEERQQLRWIALVAIVAALLLVVLFLGDIFGVDQGPLLDAAFVALVLVLLLGLPAAVAIAVLKYRLYDVDIVIRKAFVYATLAIFTTTVYVGIVVGLGSVVGGGDRSNVALQVTATALVAILFQSVRERANRLANRIVYGRRATPYEVMAAVSRRVSETVSVQDALPEMARATAKGIGATDVRVRLLLPTGDRTVWWPGGQDPGRVPDVAVRVYHAGTDIGEIAAWKPRSEPVTPGERALVEDLAGQAGLTFHNVRLTEELAARAADLAVQSEELRRSRERLVAARDVQRRRLEQDIREGPQRQLLGIASTLRDATAELEHDADAAAAMLDDLGERATSTLEGLRDLARGIFPPLLADEGIVAALEAHIRKTGANATIDATADVAGCRFGAEVETAVYFCCLQAIQNVVRHAGNAAATVTLRFAGTALMFEVADAGPGFDIASVPRGMGLQIMEDRVAALGGELEISSGQSGVTGTTVSGRVPARALEGVPA